MVVFARHSLSALHVDPPSPFVPHLPPRVSLCLLLAEVRPPLRELSLPGLAGAPFEHVVSMLRGLPLLREVDLQTPRPMDVAAIARTCTGLTRLCLGPVAHEKDVDEMRRQFENLICSPVSKSLTVLNIPWSCATLEAFTKIAQHCARLERFGAEFGALHWIRHRVFKARGPLQVDLCACAREQRMLFRGMLKSVAAHQTLKSFAVHTMDGIPMQDLELVFDSLRGLRDLDLLIGSSSRLMVLAEKSFNFMKSCLSTSLRRINIVGVSFRAEQVLQLSTDFPKLTSLTVWMGENQKPPIEVFQSFGTRVKHLRILCEWTEEMCEAVGKHNKSLESLLIVAKSLPLTAISAVVAGVGATLKEFRMFINRNGLQDGTANDVEVSARETAARVETANFILEASKVVAKGCATNLEVLNIGGSAGSDQWFADCSDIASELRKMAPQLWQICELEASD